MFIMVIIIGRSALWALVIPSSRPESTRTFLAQKILWQLQLGVVVIFVVVIFSLLRRSFAIGPMITSTWGDSDALKRSLNFIYTSHEDPTSNPIYIGMPEILAPKTLNFAILGVYRAWLGSICDGE